MLTALSARGLHLFRAITRTCRRAFRRRTSPCGDIEVEMQWFTRRPGKTVVVGVDKALAMLRHCTGYLEGEQFVDTSDQLEVWAVQDGAR